jgi:NAD-dependent dihydropyrimidine dehydrogenase PreA subunit
LPIDPNFQKKRKKVGKEKGIAIWGPVDPPEKLGIHGTYVAIDWDNCTGCGVCLKVCPQQLFEWVETFNHPTSEKKAFPARELDCGQCYKCEIKCPVQAIRIVYPPLSAWLTFLGYLSFLLMPVQVIGGPIYGALVGPYLDLKILFYIGWMVLVVGLLLFFPSFLYFKKRGEPARGRGLMCTTVLVDSGTYAIVRHPQFLGVALLTCASILISQHWLTVIIGVPIIVLMSMWVQMAEKELISKFGVNYKRYMQRVPKMNLLLGIIRLLRRKWEKVNH